MPRRRYLRKAMGSVLRNCGFEFDLLDNRWRQIAQIWRETHRQGEEIRCSSHKDLYTADRFSVFQQPRPCSKAIHLGWSLILDPILTFGGQLVIGISAKRKIACRFDSFRDHFANKRFVRWKYARNNARDFKSSGCVSGSVRDLNYRACKAFPCGREQVCGVDWVRAYKQTRSIGSIYPETIPTAWSKHTR